MLPLCKFAMPACLGQKDNGCHCIKARRSPLSGGTKLLERCYQDVCVLACSCNNPLI